MECAFLFVDFAECGMEGSAQRQAGGLHFFTFVSSSELVSRKSSFSPA